MHEQPGERGDNTKREAPRDLARAVRAVLEGWTLVSPRAAERLRRRQAGTTRSKRSELPGKESIP